MSYQSFPDSPQTADFLSSIPHRHQERPPTCRCFLQITAIFVLLFLLAGGAALLVDKSVPTVARLAPLPSHSLEGLDGRVRRLERRLAEGEKRAELENGRKLDDADRED
ncbi:hypothetical protein JCM11491_004158 [Sporobolomyces phaffii]